MVRRMKEVATKTAESYGGTAEITMLSEVPPLICDPKLTDEFVGYMKEMNIPGMMPLSRNFCKSASEDFASIAEKVPSTFMYLSAGYPDEGQYGAHNPKVQFNEWCMPNRTKLSGILRNSVVKNNKINKSKEK